MSRYLCGKTLGELQEIVQGRGLERFRAEQLENWYYVRGAKKLDDMHNVGKRTKSMLTLPGEAGEVGEGDTQAPWLEGRAGHIKHSSVDEDGTAKWLVEFGDKNAVETVYIPEKQRGTVCISSQVGCTLACSFCQTGTLPVKRNLASEEIVAQVLLAKDALNDWSGRTDDRIVSNVVYMGQGEPLYNYRSVAKSLEVLSSPSGLAISRHRIIVSTSGVVPGILRLAEEFPQVTLAVSLHAPNDELRSRVMDINRRWGMSELLAALKQHQSNPKSTRLTFEYVLLAGFNDQEHHALELARLLRPAFPNCNVNLIPFNPWPEDSPFQTPAISVAVKFQDILHSKNIAAPIRRSRGDKIQAACGQLSNKFLKSLLPTPKPRLDVVS